MNSQCHLNNMYKLTIFILKHKTLGNLSCSHLVFFFEQFYFFAFFLMKQYKS